MPNGVGAAVFGARDVVIRIRAQAAQVQRELRGVQTGLSRVQTQTAGLNATGVGAVGTFGNLSRILGGLGAIIGVGVLVSQFRRLIGAGVQFNAQIEQMQLGLKAVIAQNFEIIDAVGRQVEGTQALAAVQPLVADQIEKIKTDALLTVNTLGELTGLFQQVVTFAAPLGATLDESRILTVAIAQAAAAMGLGFQQAEQGVRALLLGMNITQSRLALALGVTKEMVDAWKEQGILVQELNKRLSTFSDAGVEAGDIFVGIVSTLQDFKEQLLGAATGPAQERLRQLFIDIRDSLGEVRGGVFVFREEVQTVLTAVGVALKATLDLLVAIVGAVFDVIAVFGQLISLLLRLDPTGGPLALTLVLLLRFGPILLGLVTAAQAFVASLVAQEAVAGLTVLNRVLIATRASLINAGAAAGILNAALTFLAAHPVLAVLGILTAIFVTMRLTMEDTTDAIKRQIDALDELAKRTTDNVTKGEQFVVSLEKDLAILREVTEATEALAAADPGTEEAARASERLARARDAQRSAVERLSAQFDEFLPFLTQEQIATAETIELLQARIDAQRGFTEELRATGIEQRVMQEKAARARVEALKTELDAIRAAVPVEEDLISDPLGVAAALQMTQEDIRRETGRVANELAEARDQLAEVTRARQALEQPPGLRARPTPETEAQMKQRLQRQVEQRKFQTSALLQVQEDALAQLQNEQRAFEAQEEVALDDRIRREEEFLRRKQAIEAEKLKITIEALRQEGEAIKAQKLSEEEEELKLLPIRRQIFERSLQLVRLQRAQETELAVFITEKTTERMEQEQRLFEFRRDIGQATVQEEIDRQKQIAAAAEDGSQRQLDAIQKVIDLEKERQRARESAAVRELRALEERLQRGALEIQRPGFGPLEAGGVELIQPGQQLTPEQVRAALAAFREERRAEVAGVQATGGTVADLIGAIETRRELRETAAARRRLGPILGPALGIPLPGAPGAPVPQELIQVAAGERPPGLARGQEFIQQQIEGFERLPVKAQDVFVRVEQLFEQTNTNLIEQSRQFQAEFPEVLFEGFYVRLRDRLRDEFGRE